jgi:hypothetical protein
MAVDFSQLPTEAVYHDEPPSRFIWTVVFLGMLLIGVFAVLVLWPKGLSTHTAKFWVTLMLFPVGIPAWIVLRRYSAYQGRKLDAELHNETVRNFNERVFRAASIPLSLIGAAYRFSTDPKENTVESLRAGAVALKPQPPFNGKGDPVKARWLVTPGMPTSPHSIEGDRRRHRHVTRWLFDELLDELSACVQALPVHVPLVIQLAITNAFTPQENEHLWRDRWQAHSLRHAETAKPGTTPLDLMMLDTWLDDTLRHTRLQATLVVVLHLQPLLATMPPADTAEAAVALLLMPEALARQHKVPVAALLHRPVRAPMDRPTEALAHALQWANCQASSIPSGWQCQLDAAKGGPWCEAAMHHGLTATLTNLDQTVGRTKMVAPWLATACAAASLGSDPAMQIILAVHEGHIDCAVLKHPRASDALNGPPSLGSAEGMHLPLPLP